MCPRLRYVRNFANSYLEEFRTAPTREQRELALSRCLDLAKLIHWVIEPQARDLGLMKHGAELYALANTLSRLAGQNWEAHHTGFAPDHTGFQTILAKLENVEEILTKIGKELL